MRNPVSERDRFWPLSGPGQNRDPSRVAILRQAVSPYLRSVRGTLAPATLEAARVVHNQTAGDPQGIATARSLGDLSHQVFVPVDRAGNGAGELLILDLWNSLPGL